MPRGPRTARSGEADDQPGAGPLRLREHVTGLSGPLLAGQEQEDRAGPVGQTGQRPCVIQVADNPLHQGDRVRSWSLSGRTPTLRAHLLSPLGEPFHPTAAHGSGGACYYDHCYSLRVPGRERPGAWYEVRRIAACPVADRPSCMFLSSAPGRGRCLSRGVPAAHGDDRWTVAKQRFRVGSWLVSKGLAQVAEPVGRVGEVRAPAGGRRERRPVHGTEAAEQWSAAPAPVGQGVQFAV